MKKLGTLPRVVAEFQTMRIGDSFIDHAGNMVEKVNDRTLFVGPGYNGEVAIADYIDAVSYPESDMVYGRYVTVEVA